MANQEQLEILKQGAKVWNKWREKYPEVKIDLSTPAINNNNLVRTYLNGIDLYRVNLSGANLARVFLWEADLTEADLSEANLFGAELGLANLTKANLRSANLRSASLKRADFRMSNLVGANLCGADLTEANLSDADLGEADLRGAELVGSAFMRTNIHRAKVSASRIYGVNVWDIRGKFKEQKDLIITPQDAPEITVDDIKVAQFVYLLLNNEEIRTVINTLTSKSVLILGRFSLPERKAVLDALRDKLREYDLLPIVFDFDRPTDKDFTETIKTLAGISYFVIADITNPKSSPLELQATVPDYQIPFVPIIQAGELPFAMMVDLQKKYPWVLPTRSYDSIETLMKALKPGIIDPAVEMRNKLRLVKAQEQVTESLRDYVDKTL